MSQLYILENLVRIQPLVHKILFRQESVMLVPTPMGPAPKTISPPHRWRDINNLNDPKGQENMNYTRMRYGDTFYHHCTVFNTYCSEDNTVNPVLKATCIKQSSLLRSHNVRFL